MRSQATKPLPKKGSPGKTAVKANSVTKPPKKKGVSPKKVKNLANKALIKNTKKTSKDSKDDVPSDKNEGDTSTSDKSDASPENVKAGPSKGISSRSNSPTKKQKKDANKDKKEPTKSPHGTKNVGSKKIVKKIKKSKTDANKSDNEDDVKYKINIDVAKKATTKFSKVKTIIKKSNINQKKKVLPVKKQEKSLQENEDKNDNKEKDNIEDNKEVSAVDKKQTDMNKDTNETQDEIKEDSKSETTTNINVDIPAPINPTSNPPTSTQSDTPKVETERPPKFFTSSRSPRVVDIDVKLCKNSKGNLSVSERFMKCEAKNEDPNKDKAVTNTLVSQGPEVDVYTFTEKVDSPKSILSDFRSPLNKNIGRVRPIARVKGTVIDKKDPEKKKYSPHRPIEEVVKQLKANKRSEELITGNQNFDNETVTSAEFEISEKDSIENPQPIVSKSYKMVARKSSITGKPFSPSFGLDQDESSSSKPETTTNASKKAMGKTKKQRKKTSVSDDEFESCKFAFNTKSFHYSSSEESVSESNDDNDTKESSSSDTYTNKRRKNKKYKRITDSAKKNTSKELRELSKDSLIDLKDEALILGGDKPSKRRLKLLSMWAGPKKHRMASLNAIAKVHCLYENESRTHMELGLMRTVDRQITPSTSKTPAPKKKETKPKEKEEKQESASESEYENNKKDKKEDSSESSDDNPPQRSLRGDPGIRSAGKYWDPKSSTSSSEDSELESRKKVSTPEKKKAATKSSPAKSDSEKPPAKMKKTAGVPVKKKRNRNEVVMDLKDMVVQKRMASLNATAILAASYEKRSPKSSKEDTTSDSCSDESFSQKSKNVIVSGVKSEIKHEDTKKDIEDAVMSDNKQKVEVIVNQESDVTITGVYSTHHHEGFCTVSGMQYRISSTSHTQTTATANCEKEGCARDDARYTPLSALSSMQPPEGHVHGHPHPVPELGGLARRAAGCSSAFSAPSPSAHHDPGKPPACSLCESARFASLGYYQPAGPMIKETGAEADRALARYHPAHYHAPHPPVLQQYGGPYYPADLCYGRYYRPPGPPYHMPPQPDAQMVGVGSESYPPQYYGSPPCYQHSHSPQRIPYVEYRGCPCPLNACPKNVLIGPATGKAPTGAGPDVPSALAPPGGAFRPKARVCVLDVATDTHGSGKDPPLEPEPPAAADAPHPCPLPAIGGASPKREIYDVRDKIRLVGDIPGPAEALGPPSPARGSAGACAPQPPPVAPRRARLGKEAARKSLADTGQLLSTPLRPRPAHSSEPDDDVMAISPPTCAPIDLSSSDERSTPLVDVKKENEGPTCATPRKPEAQALREQNTTSVQETVTESTEPKAVKRRYSRPKLEIDMKDTQLEESLKTNGIGEHVKLQKRRKVSGDLTTIARVETVTRETKRKLPQSRKTPRTPNSEKKTVKRKIENTSVPPKAKKMLLDSPRKMIESAKDDDSRVKDLSGAEDLDLKPKTKSAMLLDNLIRKNSVDRPEILSDKKLNPVELFLSPNEQNCSKKTLNINNNIVENSSPVSGVRQNTIAAVTQLIHNKLAKVDSKVTHNLKSVLKTPTDKLKHENPVLFSGKCKSKSEKNNLSAEISDSKAIDIGKVKCDDVKDNLKESVSVSYKSATEDDSKSAKVSKAAKPKAGNKNETQTKLAEESHSTLNKTTATLEDNTTDPLNEVAQDKSVDVSKADKNKRSKLTSTKNGQMKNKSIEKVAILLSKKPATAEGDNELTAEKSCEKDIVESPVSAVVATTIDNAQAKSKTNEIKTLSAEKVAKLPTKPDDMTTTEEQKEKRSEVEPERIAEKILPKRSKLTNGELKEEKKKKVEKVVKLLVSKKPAIKTDEATLVVEDACASPVPSVGRRARRRRSGGAVGRRARRPPAPLPLPTTEPRAPPRWSNGWNWDGEHYLSKVYLNNDSRLDRTARCWQRMNHASGDSVSRGDCVLLKASTGKQQQPFVARVASLWENPEDGEMMVSLVWYYRPEHTERGREPADAPDEVFASRHRDANSVACIEDKCYVLTFNEYCRYRKRLKAAEEGVTIVPTIVPPLPATDVTPAVQPNDTKLPPGVSPELVLFCRKIYDFRSKKIQVPNK